jgi:transposase IS4-like protein/DDE family transposase
VKLASALAAASEFSVPDHLEQLRQHIDPVWVEEALAYSGTASIRRRRLPADQVLWLVIGMGLFRNEPIEHVVDLLNLALPDKKDSLVAKSAISQARQRLKEEPLAYLFAVTAAEWATKSAQADRWRGLALYGLDGSTLRVPDSPENRAAFGGQNSHRGPSGYPQARIVALLALRSHILSAFRFADYGTGETTLARGIWNELPESSLAIVDRNFLVKKDLIHLETSGNRHWLTRTKTNTKWAITEKLGRDDYLAELEVHETGLPSTWQIRVIHYKRKGYPRSTLLTSLVDAENYPAKELVELYHERWETELAYDEVKTHLLDRQEAIRSRTPDGVAQELWGIALAYNLIRREIERVATNAKVRPTRISFMAALSLIRDEIGRIRGRRLALGTIPRRLIDLERNLKRLILPERRTERLYPRAVKIKMSNYPRKRPTVSRRK